MWYYHIVELIESLAFTRRLRQLAGESGEELLNSIQRELLESPTGVRSFLASAASARRVSPIRVGARENVAVTGIYTCILNAGSTYTC